MKKALLHFKLILLMVVVSCICTTAYAGVTIPAYTLENARVSAYIKEVTYKSKDATKMRNYNISPPARRDQPAAVPIKWDSWPEAASQQLIISTTSKFADPIEVNLAADASAYDIYNLIPGKIYYYKVKATDANGKDSTLISASFSTEGSVRMIKANTGFNMRDIGGWRTRTGQKIRYGMVYRGAEWDVEYVLSSADSAIVHDLGIRAELDLRGNSEADYATKSRIGYEDVEYTRIPTGTHYIEAFKNNNPAFTKQLHYIFKCVKENRPVYFHCHIGADRTGCLAFLLEGLLGVSESDLYKEYELTSFSALDTHRYKSQIEDMVDYIKTFEGSTLDEQFFTYCTQELKVDPLQIMEFKSTMLNYNFITSMDFGGDTIVVNPGETLTLDPEVTPANASKLGISYTSSDPLVATVTARGVVTGVRGGYTVITAKSNVITNNIVINVPYVEADVPEYITADGKDYPVIGPNMIENGSFEYAHPYVHWTTGINSPMDESAFQIKDGSQWGDKYLQSIYDADDESSRSIRAMWPIEKDKSYVIGYMVKTANGQSISANPCLRTSLVNINGSTLTGGGDDFIWDEGSAPSPRYSQLIVGADNDEEVFPFPSYDGEWTDVHYVFTNTEGYGFCQIWFSRLSKDGTHTCLDNFYLAEVGEGEPTAVNGIETTGNEPKASKCYDLQGRNILPRESQATKDNAIYIRDGKKYKAQ